MKRLTKKTLAMVSLITILTSCGTTTNSIVSQILKPTPKPSSTSTNSIIEDYETGNSSKNSYTTSTPAPSSYYSSLPTTSPNYYSTPSIAPTAIPTITPIIDTVYSSPKTTPTPIRDYNCISGDCYNGYGLYKYSNGDTYTGNWVNGIKSGKGTINWINGESYTGDFVNNIKSGKGTYNWNNGDTYTGDFLNDQRTGDGTYTFSNGDVQSGKFLNNVFITPATKYTPIPTTSPVSYYPPSYVDPNLTSVSTHTTPDTTFVDEKCHYLNDLSSYWGQEFTITEKTNFVLRFAAQFKADAGVMDLKYENDFKNNNPVNQVYAGFEDSQGYQYFTLPAGTYFVGMRNQVDSPNSTSLELDYQVSLPESDKTVFHDFYIKGTENITSGSKMWHGFTIEKGFRYYIDGLNSGLDVYLIPESELSNFKNNQSFKYYTDYESACNGPGQWEIKLQPGNYYLAISNKDSKTNSVNYVMERWQEK